MPNISPVFYLVAIFAIVIVLVGLFLKFRKSEKSEILMPGDIDDHQGNKIKEAEIWEDIYGNDGPKAEPISKEQLSSKSRGRLYPLLKQD